MVVHSAGISDSRGARCLLSRLFRIGFKLVKIFVDGGDKAGLILWAQAMFGYVLEAVQRGVEKALQVLPKRWVVERSFA